MKRALILAGAVLLLASCATTRSVEVPSGPLVKGVAGATTLTVGVRSLDYRKNSTFLLTLLDADFLMRIPAPGLSLYAELREPGPNLLNRVLPPDEGRALVQDALVQVLSGRASYGFALGRGWGRTVRVQGPAAPDQGPAASVVGAGYPEGAEPSDWARANGTDLTVVADVAILAQTGRGALREQPEEVRPVALDPRQGFVQVDVTTTVQVFDRNGVLVYSSRSGTPGYTYSRPATEVYLPLMGNPTGKELDAWAASPAFREFLLRAVTGSCFPFLAAVAPHVRVEDQPVRAQKGEPAPGSS